LTGTGKKANINPIKVAKNKSAAEVRDIDMWISVDDISKPVVDKDGYSRRYPVKVKGLEGWSVGRYFKSKLGSRWISDDGDCEITDWYDIPEPPK
jgi:hypothetical protein